MTSHRKTLSLLLIVSLLQAFVPMVHTSTETLCCTITENMAAPADCCQNEQPPVQMQCCPGKGLPGMETTLPAAKAAEKVLRLQLEPVAIVYSSKPAAVSICENVACSTFNPHFSNSQRYLLTAALLI